MKIGRLNINFKMDKKEDKFEGFRASLDYFNIKLTNLEEIALRHEAKLNDDMDKIAKLEELATTNTATLAAHQETLKTMTEVLDALTKK